MGDCSLERTKPKEIVIFSEDGSEKDQLIDVGFTSFDMISIIGAGAFARVMLARRRYNSTLCALKIMYKQGTTSQKTRISHAFRVEKSIMVGLNNPKILKLYYSVETEKAYVLVMEYCPGGDMFNHVLLHTRLAEKMARFYAAQIVVGLNYMHSEGVIYRDLKPENLFITKTGYLRFGDFGLSIPMKKDTEKAKYGMAGTMEFFAPEIVTNSEYNESIDWWQFGCVLYFMLTASFPFQGETRTKLCENILKEEPVYPAGLSPEALDLLKLAFTKDPSKRLNGKSAVEHPWFKDFQWDTLAEENFAAPFIPKLDSEEDVSFFDQEFTSLKIEDPFAGVGKCAI